MSMGYIVIKPFSSLALVISYSIKVHIHCPPKKSSPALCDTQPLSQEYSPAELSIEGAEQVQYINNPAIPSQQLLSPEITEPE